MKNRVLVAATCAFLPLVFVLGVIFSGDSSPAWADDPTATYIAPYVVATVEPGGAGANCNAWRTTATPDPAICEWTSQEETTGNHALASVVVCIYYTTEFSYQGRGYFESRCLSSDAIATLKRGSVTIDTETTHVDCSDVGGGVATISGTLQFHPETLMVPQYYLVEGHTTPCNDGYCSGGGTAQTGYAWAGLRLEDCIVPMTVTYYYTNFLPLAMAEYDGSTLVVGTGEMCPDDPTRGELYRSIVDWSNTTFAGVYDWSVSLRSSLSPESSTAQGALVGGGFADFWALYISIMSHATNWLPSDVVILVQLRLGVLIVAAIFGLVNKIRG